MLTAFASGPGQSYVFSVFVDPILHDTGLSRTQLSTLYAIGTGFSAAMAYIVSRLTDRFGPRLVLTAVTLAFGVACFVMSAATGPLMVLVGFASLRALGQGSLPVTATLLTVQWFVRYRGRAMAIMGLGFAASNALFPPFVRLLIDSFGWRPAYQVLGGLVWLLVLPAALLIVRDRPEALGLHPDGLPPSPEHMEPALSPHAKALAARIWLTRGFWMLALPMTAAPFVITALVFHQVSIFAERGLSPDIAAGVFVAFAAAAALMTTLSGFAIERFGPKGLLFVNLGLLFAGTLMLQIISSPLSATIYALILGSAGGAQPVIGGVMWAHYYGRERVGAIQGAAALVTITAAALAPLPLAALREFSGSYTVALTVLAVVPLICAAVLAYARPPVRAGQPLPANAAPAEEDAKS